MRRYRYPLKNASADGPANFYGACNNRHQPDMARTYTQPLRQLEFVSDRQSVRAQRGVVDQRRPIRVEEVGFDECPVRHVLAKGRVNHAHRPPVGQMI